MLVYGTVTVLAIVANKMYALFAHGVSSAAMTYTFLYLLVGGALPALLLWSLASRGVTVPRSRAAFNLYNAGIATLTVASFLHGVFEIAGTSSDYTIVMRVLGAGLMVSALVGGVVETQRFGQTQ